MPTNNCRYQFKNQRYSSHSQIFKLLKAAPVSSRVLEVGIASGFMGRCLSKLGLEITGIEKEKSLAEKAKGYYNKIFVLDLNKEDIPPLEAFDYIILADILEHLNYPLMLLKSLKPLLKEKGQIIISLPNIANWVIRLGLLFGRFDYSERGILDKSHLRFFTLKTAKQTIQDSGFVIRKLSSTSIPFQFFIKSESLAACINEIYYLLLKLYPKLFAYQFVFVAEKPKT